VAFNTQRHGQLSSSALDPEVPSSSITKVPTGQGTSCSAALDHLIDLSKLERSEVWVNCLRKCVPRSSVSMRNHEVFGGQETL
jgi:hypothetical protein